MTFAVENNISAKELIRYRKREILWRKSESKPQSRELTQFAACFRLFELFDFIFEKTEKTITRSHILHTFERVCRKRKQKAKGLADPRETLFCQRFFIFYSLFYSLFFYFFAPFYTSLLLCALFADSCPFLTPWHVSDKAEKRAITFYSRYNS